MRKKIIITVLPKERSLDTFDDSMATAWQQYQDRTVAG